MIFVPKSTLDLADLNASRKKTENDHANLTVFTGVKRKGPSYFISLFWEEVLGVVISFILSQIEASNALQTR